ncbi:MAG: methyltransferase domain-containing protein [Nannocystis sp.]|nr:methyltransferase domain-containing protein [Nannocystis sp.]MBA3549999.1 methyltransferase domain-containing protein [Nannocystis sp.]
MRPADRVVDYYEQAGPDYRAWSPHFNMHFGYYRRGMNPLWLEPMLAAMNDEILRGLDIPAGRPARVLDLGCGLGATARQLVRRVPGLSVTGLTIVPGQAMTGNHMSAAEGLDDRVRLIHADYTAIPLPDHSVDYAYAIESVCHAGGSDKAAFVRELCRVLRPGGRFVIADGFMKHARPLPRWLERVRARVCEGWAIEVFPELAAVTGRLREGGIEMLEVRDISWQVAPSVVHVPRVALRFLLDELRLTGALRLGPLRRGNLVAPLLGIVLGLARSHFGYHLVSGRR